MKDDVLLNGGDLSEVDLHPEISACHHDPVGRRQDRIQIVHALPVLQLSDDADPGTMLVQDPADLQNVLCTAHKTGCDKVKAIFDAEQDVFPVLLAHIGQGKGDAGNVDPLAVFDDAAVLHLADHIGASDPCHPHTDQPIVQQNPRSNVQIRRQIPVGHLYNGIIPEHLTGGEGKLLPRFQNRLAAVKFRKADLRAFGVQKCRDRAPQLASQPLEHFKPPRMLAVIPVGKIEARHVHAREDHVPKDLLPVRGRAKGANDLCFSHSTSRNHQEWAECPSLVCASEGLQLPEWWLFCPAGTKFHRPNKNAATHFMIK